MFAGGGPVRLAVVHRRSCARHHPPACCSRHPPLSRHHAMLM
jgi:hypothetical protein